MRATSTSLNSSLPVVPPLDPLEFARGALCAATFVDAGAARETHVAKLHSLFERAGLAPSMEAALGTMHFLREAEPLGGGYWAAAPVRTVEFAPDCQLLVGPQPTSELQRHFAGLRRVGAGRVMSCAITAALPRQSKATWRGSDGSDARAWTQSAINLAMKQLAPSIVADNLQVFALRQAGRRRREPVWVPVGSSPPCEWHGIGLFRARTGATRYRYFLGKHEGKDFLEGPTVLDAARVQYGLAALQSQPVTTTITAISGTTSISLPVAPPRSVRRLLVALCEADPRSFGCVWTCCVPAYVPVLLEALQELSCETKHYE
ncbi:hypothetical protein ABIC38_005631 [Variovorax sp. 1126]